METATAPPANIGANGPSEPCGDETILFPQKTESTILTTNKAVLFPKLSASSPLIPITPPDALHITGSAETSALSGWGVRKWTPGELKTAVRAFERAIAQQNPIKPINARGRISKPDDSTMVTVSGALRNRVSSILDAHICRKKARWRVANENWSLGVSKSDIRHHDAIGGAEDQEETLRRPEIAKLNVLHE